MGLISGAMAQMAGQKALRTHVSGNQLANKGNVEAANAKYAEARRLYEQALKQGNEMPNVRLGYSVLLLRTGDFERAREVMQGMRALKTLTDRDWFELRLNYSILLWRTGRLDEAIDTITRASAQIKNSALYTTMGMYLVDKARETGDFDAAMALCREALDYDDADAGALDNMAALYEAMMDRARADGDAEAATEYRGQAVDYYEKAHAARDRQITTLYALAKLCHEDGADDRARSLLKDTGRLYFSAICPVTKEMMDALRREVGM